MTLAELAESTGHAPGADLVEIETEIEHHYEPPIRVTPMSPASEIAALGQLTNARPERKGLARGAALVLLTPLVISLLYQLVHAVTR